MSGACGSRPRTYRSPSASGRPAASTHARNSRAPGTHPGGIAFTAPLVHWEAKADSSGTDAVRTSGRFSSDRPSSETKPHSAIRSEIASARQSCSTTTEIRAPDADRTTWPVAASSPLKSVTDGGNDSAEKKDNWFTMWTVGHLLGKRPPSESCVCNGYAETTHPPLRTGKPGCRGG